MADSTAKRLKVIVVTPERAVLDESADMVTLPMFDGELGVQPGRAAIVGQLGPGVVRLDLGATTQKYFVEGGFAQVRADVVTVLTPKATPAVEITVAKATEARATADAMPTSDAVQRANRDKAIDRARGMARAAGAV